MKYGEPHTVKEIIDELESLMRRMGNDGLSGTEMEALDHAVWMLMSKKKGQWATRRKCEYRCSTCGKIIYADDESERRYCPCCGSMNTVDTRLDWDKLEML